MELFGMVTTDWRFDREKHESFLLIYPTPLFDRMVYIDEGERRCPPEDCGGGVHGYHEMLRILNDPENPERVEYLIWLGGPYDPGTYQVPINTFRFRVEPDR